MKDFVIKINDFQGIQKDTAKPSINNAEDIVNLDIDEKTGILQLRPFYVLKYNAPSHSTVTNDEFLHFKHFYDKQADPNGKEITCLIQKGTIKAVDNGGTPIVADTLNALNFWIRPYWDGSVWVDSWHWLNKIIITKITTGSDATYPNMIKVFGIEAEGLGTNSVNKWTIINKTKNQIAQVIVSTTESTVTRIVHTLYNSTWDVNDVIILMKNYIPINYLEGLYQTLDTEIVFHKVLHDLRVGFGGQINRVGIGIGYRKKYWKIKEFAFTNKHPDLTNAVLENFSTIDEVILNPYTLTTVSDYNLGLGTLPEVTNPLAEGFYYFKLVGVLDNYAEVLIAENRIEISGAKKLSISPSLKFGAHNKRITEFKVYASTDNITFLQFKKYILTADTIIKQGFLADEDGRLSIEAIDIEYHTGLNAVSIASDTNAVGSWTDYPLNDPIISISSTTSAGSPSTYVLKVTAPIAFIKWTPDARIGASYLVSGLIEGEEYTISFYAKKDTGSSMDLFIFFTDLTSGGGLNVQPIIISSSWAQYNVTLQSPITGQIRLVMATNYLATSVSLYLDNISIKTKKSNYYTSLTTLTTDIINDLGHTPTYNLVKDWGQCIIFNGRAHYLNPYIDKRYENYIMKSHISAGYMYDIATGQEQLEIEKFEGDKTIGIILLPNGNLLVLKNNSLMLLDPETNRVFNTLNGRGCIAKDTIVDIAGIIYWCGEEDVYAYDGNYGLIINNLMEEKIRRDYLDITDKQSMVAIRGRYNTYKIKTNLAEGEAELVLTKHGWLKYIKLILPQKWQLDSIEVEWFLNSGDLYTTSKTVLQKTLFNNKIIVG